MSQSDILNLRCRGKLLLYHYTIKASYQGQNGVCNLIRLLILADKEKNNTAETNEDLFR